MSEEAMFFIAALLLTAIFSGVTVYKALDHAHRGELRRTLPE